MVVFGCDCDFFSFCGEGDAAVFFVVDVAFFVEFLKDFGDTGWIDVECMCNVVCVYCLFLLLYDVDKFDIIFYGSFFHMYHIPMRIILRRMPTMRAVESMMIAALAMSLKPSSFMRTAKVAMQGK